MTCSQADGGCPFIAGAESVFQLHMKIESIWQHTSTSWKYQERSLQIATEMLYVFSQIKSE
jgi:arsenate reductase